LEGAWKGAVSLSKVKLDDVPVSPGLIELKEDDRYLYISHNENIQSVVSQFGTGDAFRLMASSFWKPKLETITLCFAAGRKLADATKRRMNECPSEIAPEHFGHASLLFSAGRVVRQFKRMSAPLSQRRFIESRGISRKHDFPLAFEKRSEKLSM